MLNLRIKKILKRVNRSRYHRRHRLVASRVLRSIEKDRGPLSPSIKNEARDYAQEVLGWNGYAPWLYVYSAVAGRFKEGWIPDDYYGAVVVPRVKGQYGRVSSLNCLGEKLFDGAVFPDLLHAVNGAFIRPFDGRVLRPDRLRTYLFNERDRVVFKADSSNQGKGLVFFDEQGFSEHMLCQAGNGVIQAVVPQHSFFRQFVERSTATLRITTVMNDDGGVSARAAYLRFGQGRDTHVMSASHIRVAVDLDSGELADVGYTPDWRLLEAHPDSGAHFKGCGLPGYERAVDMVTRAHSSYPYVRAIGWDVVIDESSEPKVIEWNGFHNDIKFSEATQGPCFAGLGWNALGKTARDYA